MIYKFTIVDNLKNKNFSESFDYEKIDKNNLKEISKKLTSNNKKINYINICNITKNDVISAIEFGKLSESPNCDSSFFDFTRYDLICEKY